MTVGKDRNLWVSTSCAGTIERVTPKGIGTAFSYGNGNCYTSTSVTLRAGRQRLVRGPVREHDWRGHLRGRVSSRRISSRRRPSAITFRAPPLGITAGPDGAMWFTVTDPGNPFCSGSPGLAPAVGRITTGRRIATILIYPAAPGTTQTISPERIITGTDGNLYFVANKPQTGAHLALGELEPERRLGSGSIGTAGNFDDRLAYGADGNIWMTDVQDAEIIQFAGAIAGYSSGHTTAFPKRLTASRSAPTARFGLRRRRQRNRAHYGLWSRQFRPGAGLRVGLRTGRRDRPPRQCALVYPSR